MSPRSVISTWRWVGFWALLLLMSGAVLTWSWHAFGQIDAAGLDGQLLVGGVVVENGLDEAIEISWATTREPLSRDELLHSAAMLTEGFLFSRWGAETAEGRPGVLVCNPGEIRRLHVVTWWESGTLLARRRNDPSWRVLAPTFEPGPSVIVRLAKWLHYEVAADALAGAPTIDAGRIAGRIHFASATLFGLEEGTILWSRIIALVSACGLIVALWRRVR